MKEVTLKLAVAADGSGTFDHTCAIFGYLYAMQFTLGTLESGVDIVVSTQGGRAAKTLMTKSNLSASALWYPRDLVHDATGAALTGTSGGDRCLPLLDGIPRCVVTDGGVSTTGYLTLYYLDEVT